MIDLILRYFVHFLARVYDLHLCPSEKSVIWPFRSAVREVEYNRKYYDTPRDIVWTTLSYFILLVLWPETRIFHRGIRRRPKWLKTKGGWYTGTIHDRSKTRPSKAMTPLRDNLAYRYEGQRPRDPRKAQSHGGGSTHHMTNISCRYASSVFRTEPIIVYILLSSFSPHAARRAYIVTVGLSNVQLYSTETRGLVANCKEYVFRTSFAIAPRVRTIQHEYLT